MPCYFDKSVKFFTEPLGKSALSERLNVSDRSMRRWASGEDEIPPGVWREIHHLADSQRLTLEYLAPQIVPILQDNKLHPIPNTQPMPDTWGLHFALATSRGRPVRCFIRREVLDDRVSYQQMKNVLDYFKDHSDVFYRVAQRKFDDGEIGDGNLISIGNGDVLGKISQISATAGELLPGYVKSGHRQPTRAELSKSPGLLATARHRPREKLMIRLCGVSGVAHSALQGAVKPGRPARSPSNPCFEFCS